MNRPGGSLPTTTVKTGRLHGDPHEPPVIAMFWPKLAPTLPDPRAQTPFVQLSPAVMNVSGERRAAGRAELAETGLNSAIPATSAKMTAQRARRWTGIADLP